jgi:hypothetical protein
MKILRFVLVLLLPAALSAQQPADLRSLQNENAQLRERVNKLENDLTQIKAMLDGKVPPATAPAGKKPILSSLDAELYGFIKLDAAYDNSRGDAGNFMQWVNTEGPSHNDDQFSLTANQTRLGLRLKGPSTEDLVTSGLVEIDFYGGGAQNKSNPTMRHAYLTALWPHLDLSVLAGQTSDTISPLFMPTINYTVGWWQGNIGYRRPQLRLTETFKPADKVELKLEVAAARSIGRTNAFTRVGGDTGEDKGLPTFQGRASVSFPFLAQKNATLGVSGHYGQEEVDSSTSNNHKDYVTWSLNGDITVPLTAWLSLQGEYFVGENLDAYLGGIGYGYNSTLKRSIRATGGWGALTLTPSPKWQINAGAGVDDPDDKDLATGSRSLNLVIFGNAWYFFNPNFSIGLELAHQHTDYKKGDAGDNFREQLSLMYKF